MFLPLRQSILTRRTVRAAEKRFISTKSTIGKPISVVVYLLAKQLARPTRRTEVNIDIERKNRSDLDITEREYRRRINPTYDIEYERRAPSGAHLEEARQRIYEVEREPQPARESARIHVEEKTYDRESKMGYYDDSGNYHSFRRGLERAADRVLHPLHGGSREEINIKESSSARENVRYVQRPGGATPGTVTIPSHHIRIGDLVMLQGRPCQVIRITTSSQTGQHRYLGVDLFTKQLQEESSFMSNPAPSVYVQNMLGPVFKQYRVLDIHDEGIVAMTESGDVIQSLQVMDSGSVFSKLSEAFSDGKGSVRVLVINDGGRELAVDFKVIHGSRL